MVKVRFVDGRLGDRYRVHVNGILRPRWPGVVIYRRRIELRNPSNSGFKLYFMATQHN